MSTKAQVKTQARTPATRPASHISRPVVAGPDLEREADRPYIAAQLEDAARLGHSLGTVGVDRSAPPIIQCQEIPEEEEELQMMPAPPGQVALQRQELPEEEEEELQMKQAPAAIQRQELPEEEEKELMMKPEEGRVGPQGGQVPPQVEAAINRARGGGKPLGRALQEQMGASLGHDFSGVRVHTDEEADWLNQQLHAVAFTTGRHVFFKRGKYEPNSVGGRVLISHELTHVVQQGTGRVRGGGSEMAVRPAGDAYEQEADEAQKVDGRVGERAGRWPGAVRVAMVPDLRSYLRDGRADRGWNGTGGQVGTLVDAKGSWGAVVQRYLLTEGDPAGIGEEEYATAAWAVGFGYFDTCIGLVGRRGEFLTGVHLVLGGSGRTLADPWVVLAVIGQMATLLRGSDQLIAFGNLGLWTHGGNLPLHGDLLRGLGPAGIGPDYVYEGQGEFLVSYEEADGGRLFLTETRSGHVVWQGGG
jgi:hypothetical protein